MFAKRSNQVDRVDAQLQRLHATNESWFDGTVDAIDNRIAQVRAAQTPLRQRVAARDSDGEDLIVLSELETAEDELTAMREAAFDAEGTVAPARKHDPAEYARLPLASRQFVAAQAPIFVSQNLDALGNDAEMTVRASNHANLVLSSVALTSRQREITQEYFTAEVVARGGRRHVAKPIDTSRDPESYYDEMLFE